MPTHKNMSSYIGKAGEYAVASQLLSRGVPVHFPAVDMDVDLIAGASVRIQVKTRLAPTRNGAYQFGLGQKRIDNKLSGKYMREYVGRVDFIVCVGLQENRFWVIPVSAMGNHLEVQNILLGGTHKRFVDRDRIYQLIASGMKQADIAREMNIHPVSVSEFARGKKAPIPRFYHRLAELAEPYENAWHEIISAVGLAEQVDEPVAEMEGALV